jgi:hypothetical protein
MGLNLRWMINRNLFCILFSLVLLPGLVWAAAPKGEPPTDERKLVSAVDPVKKTIDITHQAHQIKTSYIFAPDVVILINGKKASIKDIKVGLQLFSLQLGPGMDDPATLVELELKTAQPKPK